MEILSHVYGDVGEIEQHLLTTIDWKQENKTIYKTFLDLFIQCTFKSNLITV